MKSFISEQRIKKAVNESILMLLNEEDDSRFDKYGNPQQILDKLINLVKSRADEDYIISFIEKIKRAV